MQSTLILFCDNFEDNDFSYQKQKIIKEFSLVLQNIDCVVLLSPQSSVRQILDKLSTSAIIGVGNCSKVCLENIYNAINNFYTKPIKTNYGLFCNYQDKYCSVIDLVRGIDYINYNTLSTIYGINNILHFGLYGIKSNEIFDMLRIIEGIDNFEYAYYEKNDLGTLSLRPKNNNDNLSLSQIYREIHNVFGVNIFCDDILDLDVCVNQLLEIRNMRFSIIDNTNEKIFIKKLSKISNFDNYNITFDNKVVNEEFLKQIVYSGDIKFAIYITEVENSFKIYVITENKISTNKFDLPLNIDNLEKIYNFLLFNLFDKLY